MEYIVIGFAAVFTSGLTLFSGFGVGTILMPMFALFFPMDVAISMTAIVHLLNNLFKLFLLGRHANRAAVLSFGLPAIVAAFLGAWLLLWFSNLQPVASYDIGGRAMLVTPVKLVVSVLMVIFALFEIVPRLENLSFDRKYLPLGGVLSGFFGGVSGHQGALRSAFLLKYGLSKESFIATGVVIACIIDVSRLVVYTSRFSAAFSGENAYLLVTAIAAAFLGAFLGNRLLKKITMRTVRILVAVMLFVIAVGLGTGII